MKKIAALLAPLLIAGGLMVGTTACTPPCEGLVASDRDRQAAADDYDVEREDSMGNECELDEDGSWELDD